jgi:hypothetical protein
LQKINARLLLYSHIVHAKLTAASCITHTCYRPLAQVILHYPLSPLTKFCRPFTEVAFFLYSVGFRYLRLLIFADESPDDPYQTAKAAAISGVPSVWRYYVAAQ